MFLWEIIFVLNKITSGQFRAMLALLKVKKGGIREKNENIDVELSVTDKTYIIKELHLLKWCTH